MAAEVDLLRAVEAAPMRTVRYQDIASSGTNVWRVLDGLVADGALARLAQGVYTAPPPGRDGRQWTPGLETAGLAIATARHGVRQAILMGVGAARFLGAFPRAIGNTVIAVPAAGRHPVSVRAGTIHFAARDLDRMDAALETTELGHGLVTTPAQTLFDLLMRPAQGGEPEVAREAADNLLAQVDPGEFDGLMSSASRLNQSVRRAARVLAGAR
ncbi:MAG: type IV toxin-antitoxin system AbiEi family antitoxin [Acidipropionibacterium acidipropionici]|jgi:hypothetical protein|uniref:type IV toxin-antitoxin system AbiEi family antitoxin n=1 Tax=Acidipropionibacterium acidipropionici TaxID=1748 RepID=UPI000686D64B|nr:type IV toxin-antitoxin system AbiEi family antitoxin [Acidipropionibacterium acidipropionici]ALN14994.1 hypothetical protein ASQ49_06540 [Acidipropionibacterium acidipropionici]APZ09255.1 hypothetical protein BWX38_08390 [Acidipropionibacterium acidipropionici]QCV93970.1 hypothetical protein FEZ30_00610 [Acidipropionibacterium acidipropionici]